MSSSVCNMRRPARMRPVSVRQGNPSVGTLLQQPPRRNTWSLLLCKNSPHMPHVPCHLPHTRVRNALQLIFLPLNAFSPAPHVYSNASACQFRATQASVVRRYSRGSRVVANARVPRRQHLFRRVVVNQEVPALFG
jgi:hypothetical protein